MSLSTPHALPIVQPDPAGAAPREPQIAIEEIAARHLEATGRFRILRQLPVRRREEKEKARRKGRRIAAVVDVETSGLDHANDEVIEFGGALFSFDEDGTVHDVLETITEFQQPSRPLASQITMLTGISEDMLAGRSIDRDRISRFIEPAEFVIAHNAEFDRRFCEKLSDRFRTIRWGCSLRDVSWGDLGRGGLKLSQLLAGIGFFHCGHRALDDSLALLEILAGAPDRSAPPLADICRAVVAPRIEIRAERAPYEARQVLKHRGYRWGDGSDGWPKCWWKEVTEDQFEAETSFLKTQVYRSDIDPVSRRLDATNRYR